MPTDACVYSWECPSCGVLLNQSRVSPAFSAPTDRRHARHDMHGLASLAGPVAFRPLAFRSSSLMFRRVNWSVTLSAEIRLASQTDPILSPISLPSAPSAGQPPGTLTAPPPLRRDGGQRKAQ
jgi:hypothetical protein